MLKFFKFYALSCFIIYSSELLSLQYGLSATRKNTVPLTKFAVFAERCSGSNYVESLLKLNFELVEDAYCHKHFPPWFTIPRIAQEHKQYHLFKKNEDVLNIIIFRNPYDWVRSLHNMPWHAVKSLFNISFSKFIRAPWKLNPKVPVIVEQAKYNSMLDINPKTKHPFKNVFELRTAKIKTMLLIKDHVANSYYVNYETVRDHPKEVIQEIASLFDVKANLVYQPVIYYKGKEEKGVYTKKKYIPMTVKDHIYINDILNKKLESEIGYRLLTYKELPQNAGD
jgi:hypothetical protein